MGEPSEKDIARLLAAAAQQRRQQAGGPFELHAATRQMLRDEAVRTHRPARRGGLSWLAGLVARHRFAWRLAALVGLLLGLVATILPRFQARSHVAALPQPPERKLALARDEAGMVAPPPAASAPAPTASPANAAPGRLLATAPSQKPQSTVKAPAALAGTGQSYYRVASGQAVRGDQAAAEPLTAFRFVQAGNQLQVIDQDGSAYTGSVQTAGALMLDAVAKTESAPSASVGAERRTAPALGQRFGRAASRADASAAAAARGGTQGEMVLSFQVQGTNRTLNQPVQFSGQLILQPNAPRSGQGVAGQPAPTGQTTGKLGPATQARDQSRISGELRVGNRPPTQVEAAPTER